MKTQRMGLTEWALLLALSLVWGGSFFFIEIGLEGLGPYTVVAARVGLGALGLLLFLGLRGLALPSGLSDWWALFVMGLLNNAIPFSLIAWGQVRIDSGLASILNATTPLFTLVVAHLCTRDERLTSLKGLGVVLGLFGVAVLIGPNLGQGSGGSLWGQLAILGAACSYAFASVWGRRLGRLSPAVAATGMLICSSVVMLPLALLVEPLPAALPSPSVLVALVGLGLLSTSLAYLLYFQILVRAGAVNLMLVTFLIPPSALALGVLFLHEPLEMSALFGLALIFAGLAAVQAQGRVAAAKPSRALQEKG